MATMLNVLEPFYSSFVLLNKDPNNTNKKSTFLRFYDGTVVYLVIFLRRLRQYTEST